MQNRKTLNQEGTLDRMPEGYEPLHPKLRPIVWYALNAARGNLSSTRMQESTRLKKNEILQKLGDLTIKGRESDAPQSSDARSAGGRSDTGSRFGDVSDPDGDSQSSDARSASEGSDTENPFGDEFAS